MRCCFRIKGVREGLAEKGTFKHTTAIYWKEKTLPRSGGKQLQVIETTCRKA